MLKAVLHALAIYECTYTIFLMVMILPVLNDTPRNSTAIRGHGNMSTLIQIPAGHVNFVLAHKHADGVIPDLYPAKWLVEFVLIANGKGQEAFLIHDRIQTILAPVIQTTCRLTPLETRFSSDTPRSGEQPRDADAFTPVAASPYMPIDAHPGDPVEAGNSPPFTFTNLPQEFRLRPPTKLERIYPHV